MMSQPTRISPDDHRIVVVCAADEGFAMPLAVTIRSVIENLAATHDLVLYVLDGGLRKETRERVVASWNQDRLVVHWISFNRDTVEKFPISDHVTAMTYCRLLISEVLPENVNKVIYLDCDTVVLGDLAALWNCSIGANPVMAAQDMAAPYIDSGITMRGREGCIPYLAAATPVKNYRSFGIEPGGKYFNAGVLLLNLRKWREEKLSEGLLECLRVYAEHVLWWDQYALNVIFASQWTELDPRWNVQAHLFKYPSHDRSPFEEAVYSQLTKQPLIVHYSSPEKPWHWGNRHPYRDRFFDYLDRTDWAGWRPSRPSFRASEWYRGTLKSVLGSLRFLKRKAVIDLARLVCGLGSNKSQ